MELPLYDVISSEAENYNFLADDLILPRNSKHLVYIHGDVKLNILTFRVEKIRSKALQLAEINSNNYVKTQAFRHHYTMLDTNFY